MQDTDDLLTRAKLKIIVVPISPISKIDFANYLSLFQPFSTVVLGELSSLDSKTGNNKR
jgi:hypothetical protein